MDEYIERETAVMRLMQDGCSAKNVQTIMELPAADVAPVRHGAWIEIAPAVHKYYECSNCGAHENKHTAIKGRYCWRCGAKMDGAE
jgi:hypothetical protein